MRRAQRFLSKEKCGHCLNASTKCAGNSERREPHRASGLETLQIWSHLARDGEKGIPNAGKIMSKRAKGERATWLGTQEVTGWAAFCHFLFSLFSTSPAWLLVFELIPTSSCAQLGHFPKNWHRRTFPLVFTGKKKRDAVFPICLFEARDSHIIKMIQKA